MGVGVNWKLSLQAAAFGLAVQAIALIGLYTYRPFGDESRHLNNLDSIVHGGVMPASIGLFLWWKRWKCATLKNECKVCGYEMPTPPVPHDICPCCGTQYGLDDAFDSYQEIRSKWLAAGGRWFSKHPSFAEPDGWSARGQLEKAGLL